MKHLPSILLIAATLAFDATSHAQTTPPGATTAPAAKPKPFSSNDTRNYVAVAEMLQYHLNMGTRLRGKFKETDQDLVSFGGKLSKEATELYTPGVNLAMARGVPNDKIPQAMSKADAASVGKLNTIKDDKKWTVAFLELFAKDSKKHASDAEKVAKSQMDPELKTWVEKVAAMIKSQSEAVDAKFKERKAMK
jgi:hypothetical protein